MSFDLAACSICFCIDSKMYMMNASMGGGCTHTSTQKESHSSPSLQVKRNASGTDLVVVFLSYAITDLLGKQS